MKKYFNFFGRVWMRATSGSFSPAPACHARRITRTGGGQGVIQAWDLIQGLDMTSPLIQQSLSHVTIKSRLLDDPRRWMTPNNPRDSSGAGTI